MSSTDFALNHFVDDHESARTGQSFLVHCTTRCAFVHYRVFYLTLKQFFFVVNTTPHEIEPLLFLVWVKQPVTRCTEIFLHWRVRCDFWRSFLQNRFIVPNVPRYAPFQTRSSSLVVSVSVSPLSSLCCCLFQC